MTARTITESTPVSMGVATALVVVTLTVGGGIEHFRARILRVEEAQAENKAWATNVDNILLELKDITKEHKRRLDEAERDRKAELLPKPTLAAPAGEHSIVKNRGKL